MYIQNYQIHNVLNAYRRQLSQLKPEQSGHMSSHSPAPDAVKISAEGKNQSIMEKVADNVLKKITNVEPGIDFGREITRHVQQSEKNTHMVAKDSEFVFNTIEENNQKETRSIAVDNSQVLMNRLNELAQAAVNHKAE